MPANRNSRYWRTALIRRGTDTWFMGQQSPDLTPAQDDLFHEVQAGDNLQLLAYSYYGDVRLWWVIGYWNSIVDPFETLTPGTPLRFPSLQRLALKVLN